MGGTAGGLSRKVLSGSDLAAPHASQTCQPQEVPGLSVLIARPYWAGFAALPQGECWSQTGQE